LRKARSAFHDRDLLDFLDPHRRLRRRKRLVRSLLIIGTLVSLFALMMLSSASPFSPTKAVSKILARKFGNGASQKSAAFSWGGAELRDVKIDPKNDSRVGRATAQIEWNPLSKQFGSPNTEAWAIYAGAVSYGIILVAIGATIFYVHLLAPRSFRSAK